MNFSPRHSGSYLLSPHEIIPAVICFSPQSSDSVSVQVPSHLHACFSKRKSSLYWQLYSSHSHYDTSRLHFLTSHHSDPLKSDFCLCSSNQLPPLWPPVTLLFDKVKALSYEYFCLLLLETFFLLDFQLRLRYFHSFYIPWSGLLSCHTILVSRFKFNLTYYISNPDNLY